MIIRDATPADLDQVIALGERMRAESQALREGRLPYPGIERQRVLDTIRIALAQPQWFMAKVAETDRIVGMMAGTISLWAFSSHILAVENNIYVAPEARGSRAGYLLMKAFEAWARENRASYCKAGVYTGMEEVGSFYERLGYEYIGASYIKCVAAPPSP